MQLFLSYGPFKRTNKFKFSTFFSIIGSVEVISFSKASSGSSSNKFINSIFDVIVFFSSSIFVTCSFKSFNFFNVSSALLRSFQKFISSVLF